MKKIIAALFLFFAVTATADDAVKSMGNEYWSWDNGNPDALVFKNYFLSDDNTFIFSWGYSGSGAYYVGWHSGSYFYDPEMNKIIFSTVKSGNTGDFSMSPKVPAPKELKILEFTDNGMVRIDISAAHEKPNKNTGNAFDGVMKRHIGRIKEQKWTLTNYTTAYEFYFDPQGNCFYTENKQGFGIDSQYECEYNLISDMLFLQVKSARIKNEVVQYDPPVKTYIRLGKSSSGEIQAEKVDSGSILGASRNWNYNDGKYTPVIKLPAVKEKDFYSYRIEKGNSGSVIVEDGNEIR